MTRNQRVLAICACILHAVSHPLPAWNEAGHRAIAFLAYSHLTPAAKARVAEILRVHPDLGSGLKKNRAGVLPSDVSRDAFLVASAWPDLIRNDPRFERSAPALPGFSDMDRHTNWHFINIPVPAQFAKQPVDPVNGPAQLPKLIAELRSTGPVTAAQSNALPWILHIIGDLHQPLHTVARYSMVKGKPVHDRGGNDCWISGGTRLHSLLDGLLGRSTDDGIVARLAASLEDEHPLPSNINTRPDAWVREGVALAVSEVYNFPGKCTPDAPATLPSGYEKRAKHIARERAAVAAYRIAAILNHKLGR